MTVQTNQWRSAFAAFLDRRAIIMLFLGFSAGIPILLIFSSLSLWLGEAGVNKSAVTMFSWAALGYSFKFVWAPLIDALPVPYLTKTLGRRRAWLLVAQLFIIVAIVIMAMTDPAAGTNALIQMAIGAVLLGFASATQDIVIDAYRIELADTNMQTVLASTYNAGYRIGMIVAGAGALFLASGFGTAKGNYVYQAWQQTYWIMAAVMLIGVATTLWIHEPGSKRVRKHYPKREYGRLVGVFALAVVAFVVCFMYLGNLTAHFNVKDPFLAFLVESVRFIGAAALALAAGWGMVKFGAVNKEMALETWVVPVSDFFKRYGTKVALALLLLIGFFRISDIIAGVISNVFYQDMNFTKEQIAEAVKIYGVIFSLVGGFLGGLLSQRFDIMKVMFVGAVLASTTNLAFVGLVHSGSKTTDVTVKVGSFEALVPTDEVGFWKVDVPSQYLLADTQIQTHVALQNGAVSLQQALPYLKADKDMPVQLQLLPLTQDGVLTPHEQAEKFIVLEGQLLGQGVATASGMLDIVLDGEAHAAKLEPNGRFSVALSGETLATAQHPQLTARYQNQEGQVLESSLAYEVADKAPSERLEQHLDALPLIEAGEYMYTVSGKVIKQYSDVWLYAAIIIDNLAAGLAGAAFIAFLSSLTSVSFTAVQYAIFSSLMTLLPKIIGGYSGAIVSNIGYPNFFYLAMLVGLPVLVLVWWVNRLMKQKTETSAS
ncbi:MULTISPECIES: AmpG family muropeptide MFS transporter [Vitreoscilla]|uniref:MFS transporter n=1 Tax=Vitreoscilla stercoraria TaxID=61 RepID=A0ABY4EB02_VITST|nr:MULTISPECIES: MFS transporter [Vitreoscilla]AUZ05673.2 hypothetical protein ADP71_22870 [Vitreoscilla sp. C1]UOO92926.1 MFS transporter [Vitreoscilla stercoraria]